jgi:hypothetical protein
MFSAAERNDMVPKSGRWDEAFEQRPKANAAGGQLRAKHGGTLSGLDDAVRGDRPVYHLKITQCDCASVDGSGGHACAWSFWLATVLPKRRSPLKCHIRLGFPSSSHIIECAGYP